MHWGNNMYGSLVKSSTGISSANSVVSIDHHTSCIYVSNLDKDNDATIKLNGTYQIILPHVPNGATHLYHAIPGDYTTIEVTTANTVVAFYAIG